MNIWTSYEAPKDKRKEWLYGVMKEDEEEEEDEE